MHACAKSILKRLKMLFRTFLEHFFDAFALAALCFWNGRAMLLELPNHGRTMLLELPNHGRRFVKPRPWACLRLDRDDAAAATSMPQRLRRSHSRRLDTAVARRFYSGHVNTTVPVLMPQQLPWGVLDKSSERMQCGCSVGLWVRLRICEWFGWCQT